MVKNILSIILCMPLLMLSGCYPGDQCGEDMILDCNHICTESTDAYEEIADGTCDPYLNCKEFNFDGGDCEPS